MDYCLFQKQFRFVEIGLTSCLFVPQELFLTGFSTAVCRTELFPQAKYIRILLRKEQKWRDVHLVWQDGILFFFLFSHYSTYLLTKPTTNLLTPQLSYCNKFPFIKNWVTGLIRGRKLIRVTQSLICIVIWWRSKNCAEEFCSKSFEHMCKFLARF